MQKLTKIHISYILKMQQKVHIFIYSEMVIKNYKEMNNIYDTCLETSKLQYSVSDGYSW